MTSYLVVSSKPWSRKRFNSIAPALGGEWIYAENREELNRLAAEATPRYIFFLHWNWSVPSAIRKKHECVCFHMTDAPYGRGGSPVQNLTVAGHKMTTLTALRMVEEPAVKADKQPVYASAYDKSPCTCRMSRDYATLSFRMEQ